MRTVILSTNNNPDYLFYVPFAEHAWNKIGWRMCLLITHDVERNKLRLNNPETLVYKLPLIEGLRIETIAQTGRLYAANYIKDDVMLMTGDIDLLPLSDYWHPDETTITVYGHDLTDFTHYPMGYIAMTCKKWAMVMGLKGDTSSELENDCKEIGLAYSDDMGKWWHHDWTLATKRIKPHFPHFHNRGKRKGTDFAYGRIDRGDSMQMIQPPYIDAHCVNTDVRRPDVLKNFLAMYESIIGQIPYINDNY